ncbi:protein YLS9-like isoform X1 [Cucumis melo var. makuwa]|uniref:Protein YLS9-like isoform X1 n=1 Tax=Cucumis melo var. makuwa TaxID=1194695 RepID=A0A5D3BYJ3_CUCMM|nr:protein YLS9-like isoform X1 [Cucumis melo var. makuwa]
MNDKAPYRPSDVNNYMKIHHGVNVSYDKAWRECVIALNSIRSNSNASYAMLSAFLDALIRNNPGIDKAKEADDEGRVTTSQYTYLFFFSDANDESYLAKVEFISKLLLAHISHILVTCPLG